MWGGGGKKRKLFLWDDAPHLHSTVSHGRANPYYSLSCEWERTVEKPQWHSTSPCMSISVRREMCLYSIEVTHHFTKETVECLGTTECSLW